MDCCKHCGAIYEDCAHPVSHDLPTIIEITLPGLVDRLSVKYNTRDYAQHLTAEDREILNAINIYHN